MIIAIITESKIIKLFCMAVDLA